MKKLTIILLALIIFSCKKEKVTPTITTIQHDTIVKNIVDTIYCIPKSDIIQGSWVCYKYTYPSGQNIASDTVIFTKTTYYWQNIGSASSGSAFFSQDYSEIFINGASTPSYDLKINNCNEIKLLEYNGPNNGSGPTINTICYLRRF